MFLAGSGGGHEKSEQPRRKAKAFIPATGPAVTVRQGFSKGRRGARAGVASTRGYGGNQDNC